MTALQQENAELRRRLLEAEETLAAIRAGQVDAIVIEGAAEAQVFSLAGAETVYRLAVQTMAEAVLNVSPDGTILFGNARFSEFVGLPAEQLIGRRLGEFVAAEERAPLGALLAQCCRQRVRQRIVLCGPNGRPRPVQLTGEVLVQGEDRTLCLVAADLSELESSAHQLAELRQSRAAALKSMEDAQAARQEAERAAAKLRASEQRFRALTEKGADLIGLVDGAGRLDYESPNQYRILRYPAGGLTGRNMFELVHPEDLPIAVALFGQLLAEPGGSRGADLRVRTGEQQWCWLEIVGTNLLADPAVAGIVLNARDITERKHAEEVLAATHRQMQDLIDNTTALVYACDLEGRFVLANTALAALFKTTPAELLGKRRHEFMPPADAAAHEANDRKVVAAGQVVEFEEHNDLHGRSITWLSTKLPLRDAHGRIYGVAGIVTDITARKQAEEALQQFNATLEHQVAERTAQLTAVNQELEAFCYSVSHDLRAPLRSVDGFSRILQQQCSQQIDATGQDCLDRIRRACQNMGQLIDDLLRLSRLSRAELRLSPVDLSALAGEIVAELRHQEPEREVEVQIAAGLQVNGDATLLRQALWNLLENAWKFTRPRTPARIELGREGTVFHVRDNGVGFDMTYAGKLFGPFQRLHATSEFAGTGIGLAIVQRILQRHGGRVWAQATPGQGATFYFELP